MAVTIKSAREIEYMREAGRLLAEVHEELGAFIRPGISTLDIDMLGEKLIRSRGCVPNFLNYNGYPASICVSVNDEVVHGIPNAERILQEGDIVSLDAGLIYKGYHSDAARTHAVGRVSEEAKKLIQVTRQSFFEGIKAAREGNHLHDISAAIDDYVSAFGYGIVRDLVGHGIGTHLHEDPQIPNFRQKRKGVRLQAGMTLAVEPMINAGGWQNWMPASDAGYGLYYEWFSPLPAMLAACGIGLAGIVWLCALVALVMASRRAAQNTKRSTVEQSGKP